MHINTPESPRHDGPRGTVKTQTVLEGVPTSLEAPRGFVRPMKKKKMRKTLQTPLTIKVSDDDFILLEAFILELLAMKEPPSNGNQKFNDQVI